MRLKSCWGRLVVLLRLMVDINHDLLLPYIGKLIHLQSRSKLPMKLRSIGMIHGKSTENIKSNVKCNERGIDDMNIDDDMKELVAYWHMNEFNFEIV